MNHQMIVVKLLPLWMLLLRGSTSVYSGAHTVLVGDLWYGLYTQEVPLLVPAGQERCADESELLEFIYFWSTQASPEQSKPKHLEGKDTGTWKPPSEATPGSLGAWQGCEQQGHRYFS